MLTNQASHPLENNKDNVKLEKCACGELNTSNSVVGDKECLTP